MHTGGKEGEGERGRGGEGERRTGGQGIRMASASTLSESLLGMEAICIVYISVFVLV